MGGVIKGQAQLSAHRQGSVWLSQSQQQLKKRETGKGSGDEDDSSVASLMRNAPTRANVGGIGRVRGFGGFHVWYIATNVALLNLRKAPAHGQSSAFAKKRLSRSCGAWFVAMRNIIGNFIVQLGRTDAQRGDCGEH